MIFARHRRLSPKIFDFQSVRVLMILSREHIMRGERKMDKKDQASNLEPQTRQIDEDSTSNRNLSTSEPNEKELSENLSGADSSLEKPKNQDR